ncbi:structural protein MipA [Lysobacteraceae bacterium NML93-0792]|nr:structural protein MipA [Xanthomonadaceae bacterium NML93-0792]PBS16574.1 structural protein MipA [Xanthomonadaceae bacterium NML93-0793]PBS19949.1 structural protein MipA [Xanthomonadaceae bacterium NML93-0831]
MIRPVLFLTLLLPLSAFAQSDSSEQEVPAADDRWTLGLGVSAKDTAYAGEDIQLRPAPLINFQGERFYWQGVTLGMHLWNTPNFSLDAVVSGRFDGFDTKDLGREELAANGIDFDRLDDRDDAADAGIAARWQWQAHQLHVRALADITDTSSGYELSADYGYRVQLGHTTLIPGVGARWMSDDMANYYYGVAPKETFAGVGYQADAALVPHVGVAFSHPLAGKWRLQGLLRYQFLPNELSDSPLLERDTSGTAQFVLGVSRGF